MKPKKVKSLTDITMLFDDCLYKDFDKRITKRINELSKKYNNIKPLRFKLDVGWEYTEIYLQYERDETQQEMNARAERAKMKKQRKKELKDQQIKTDIENYERLKQKLEDLGHI